MNKSRINALISIANDVIRNTDDSIRNKDNTINSVYNGHIAALPVAIAMSGLKPAVAIYYQDKSDNPIVKVNKRELLRIIGKMIEKDSAAYSFKKGITDAESLTRTVLSCPDGKQEKELKREIIECSIALKLVIRTYKLV